MVTKSGAEDHLGWQPVFHSRLFFNATYSLFFFFFSPCIAANTAERNDPLFPLVLTQLKVCFKKNAAGSFMSLPGSGLRTHSALQQFKSRKKKIMDFHSVMLLYGAAEKFGYFCPLLVASESLEEKQ